MCVYVRVCVCVCMCPPPRLVITSGVMWHDMDPMRLAKQVLQLFSYMTSVIVIVNGPDLGIGTCYRH